MPLLTDDLSGAHRAYLRALAIFEEEEEEEDGRGSGVDREVVAWERASLLAGMANVLKVQRGRADMEEGPQDVCLRERVGQGSVEEEVALLRRAVVLCPGHAPHW